MTMIPQQPSPPLTATSSPVSSHMHSDSECDSASPLFTPESSPVPHAPFHAYHAHDQHHQYHYQQPQHQFQFHHAHHGYSHHPHGFSSLPPLSPARSPKASPEISSMPHPVSTIAAILQPTCYH
ncbi:hypothetical protein BGW38_010984 [Lunasporangiospora selenospora]|uniref:Uncharacterized protein n=1 Tax=Lunasporangiospora selenospora TaxID=979761 RepID=A0A9P6FVR1_9FUNG|nr:hypothetical protein BGW38_010984 [Lunasporangiospora selenospora]